MEKQEEADECGDEENHAAADEGEEESEDFEEEGEGLPRGEEPDAGGGEERAEEEGPFEAAVKKAEEQ